MKVALYCRVSTEEQAKNGISIDAQRDKLVNYCKNNNFTYDLYADEGFSGGKFDRPSLQRMLSKCREYELVIITRLDRLSRSVKDANVIAEKLQDNNCGLIALNGDINGIYSPADKFRFNIMLSVAQFEREADSEKINANNRYKAMSEGTVMSGIKVFGYDIVDKRYVVNEKEAIIINEMFNKVKELGSIRATFNWFIDKYGIVDYSTFRDRFKMTKYYGEYNYHGEITTKLYPPIISKKLFDEVQDVLKYNIKIYGKSGTKRIYIFSGLIVCPNCGNKLTSTFNKKKYYRCNRYYDYKRCNYCYNWSEEKIEKILLKKTPHLLSELELETKKKEKKEDNKAKIKNLKSKLERVKELYIDGAISKEEYNKRTNNIKNELDEEERKNKSIDFKKFNKMLRSNRSIEIYNSLDEIHKRSFWQEIISKIEVINRDDLNVIFKVD